MAKKTKIQEAYERCAKLREKLYLLGARSMEITEDKAGIVWERLIIKRPGETNEIDNLILYSTPHYSELFGVLINEKEYVKFFAELDKRYKRP